MFGIKSTKQLMAAQNALVAKYTYNRLDETGKDSVIKEAISVLENDGYPNDLAQKLPTERERVRYLFYSHAMMRLGIKPALRGILYHDNWNDVTGNPFATLIDGDKAINSAKLMIKDKQNIDIDLT